MEKEWGCGAAAAAVMDAWVRFSAQSQARERLCRCGLNRNGGEDGQRKVHVRRGQFILPGSKRVNSGYGGPDGPLGADLSRP